MNYRHAYHAGNFADVLKHLVLALVIDYMKRKEAPFRVIDTHAGCGRYALGSIQAAKTGEWRGGIGRLLGPDARPLPPDVANGDGALSRCGARREPDAAARSLSRQPAHCAPAHAHPGCARRQ